MLAIENAPAGKRAWYGMFPQMGPPVGFILSGGIFLALSKWLTNDQFFAFGWRIPFLASAILVIVGLYVRLTISGTPVFREAISRRETLKVPVVELLRKYPGTLVIGSLASLATFTLFYLMTVFALSWGSTQLGYGRSKFLVMQLVAILFFAAAVPISGILAERGRRATSLWANGGMAVFRLFMGRLFTAGTSGTMAALAIGMTLAGFAYGPLGTLLAELFPTQVRYSASSIAFSFAGILGASLAPYIAIWLASRRGLSWVGYYLTAAALLTVAGLLAAGETKDVAL